VICLRTIRAIVDGRFEDAERLAADAHELGRLRHSGYAYVHRYAQLFAIRWAQGRAHELREINEGHGDRFPWVARWRDALVAAELGDAKAARAEVERYAGHDFADLPRDGLWILLLCSLAEACVLLGDERRGERLYELLLPHADRNAVAYTQVPLGPVALRLGMLAAMFGRRPEAEHHFSSALRRCDALGARPVRARVLLEHARMLRHRRRRPRRRDARRGRAAVRRARHARHPRARRRALAGRAHGRCAIPAGGRVLDDRIRREHVPAPAT
jgi:hypothetical protein